MSRAGKGRTTPAADYGAKTAHEVAQITRRKKKLGYPPSLGNPASGVMLLAQSPAGPRITDALAKSLEAVNLPDAYVTWPCPETLLAEFLAAEPSALVALGPQAAREIDALSYPLARSSFVEASVGTWFSWTGRTTGLLLPPLAPALDDENAKQRFWRAFLTLRTLSATKET